MRNRTQTGIGVGLLVVGVLCTAAAQQTHATAINVVVPEGDQPGDGISNTLVGYSERTYQVQIAEEHLTDLVGRPLLGLRWRSRSGFDEPGRELTWENYDITLAEAANPIDDFSETFADNMKPDTAVQVRSGPLTIEEGAFSAEEEGPNPWGPLIGFDTAYTYTGGDLVIEYRHGGNREEFFWLDAVDSDAEAGYLAQFADSYEAGSATAPGTAVVTTQFEAVPSPTAAGLGMALMAGLVMRRPRRGRG